MSQYVRFEFLEKKPKTNVYAVINIFKGIRVGIIKWFSPWRQYCLFPDEETVYNKKCMQEINNFISEKMEERKTKSR